MKEEIQVSHGKLEWPAGTPRTRIDAREGSNQWKKTARDYETALLLFYVIVVATVVNGTALQPAKAETAFVLPSVSVSVLKDDSYSDSVISTNQFLELVFGDSRFRNRSTEIELPGRHRYSSTCGVPLQIGTVRNLPRLLPDFQKRLHLQAVSRSLSVVCKLNIPKYLTRTGSKFGLAQLISGPDNRSLFSSKLILSGLQSRGSCVGSAFSCIGRLLDFGVLLDNFSELATHYLKLAVVNAQSKDSYDSQGSVDKELGKFNPPKLPRKFTGGIILIVGSAIGIVSNLILGWSGWRCARWRLRTRLGFWVIGWSIAVCIVCHSATILLGIN